MESAPMSDEQPVKRKRGRPRKPKLAVRSEQLGGLSDRQIKFANEYIATGNASLAYKKAGYTGKSSKEVGKKMLRNPAVAEMINAAHRKAAAKAQVTVEQVIDELAKVGFSEDITPVKVKALELLGKHLQMFTEKVELKVDAMSPEERAARAAALLATAKGRLLLADKTDDDEPGE